MNETDLEAIVRSVTRQVMAAIGQEGGSAPETEGLRKILAVGDPSCIPADMREDAVVLSLEDYTAHRNILRYDRLIITRLSITQMADIALGRMGDEAACAVICALLSGVEVSMLDDALTFRKFAGKGSTSLYQLLEDYARTLQVYGVKPAGRAFKPAPLPEAKPPKFAPPPMAVPQGSAKPNSARLITEADALELVKQGPSVSIPAGTIVTPSAQDVFSRAKVTLALRK